MASKRSGNFAERLRQARTDAGLSQDTLAEKLNIAERTIRHYEAGTKEPSLHRLPDIATATGKPVGWFFDDPLPDGLVVPLFDEVPAGPTRLPEQEVQAMVVIPSEWARGSTDVYCLRVRGRSMDPIIRDKDIIAVRQQPEAEHGEVVVATLPNGEYVVKRLVKRGGEAALESVNHEYGVVVAPEGFQVNGRVVGLFRCM